MVMYMYAMGILKRKYLLLASGMRGFAMGGQQFPQFFAPGSRASLLGPVPMGVAIKTPHMGYPRHFSPHARYFSNVSMMTLLLFVPLCFHPFLKREHLLCTLTNIQIYLSPELVEFI